MIEEEAKQAVDTRSEIPNRKVRSVDEELFNIAAERAQIGDRIKKLEGAIKADPPAVSDKHKRLWRVQLAAMECYYNALGDRIRDFVDQTQRGEAQPGTDPA